MVLRKDEELDKRGKIKMQNAFPTLSKTPSTIRRPAPAAPGQDNAEVFAERLGMGAEELARLAEAGII
jgi:formyl-CoA transferase